MSTAKRIYAVSSGSYEDFRIEAAFTSEPNADAYIKQVDIDDATIVTFELDSNIAHYLKGEAKYCITMFKDGEVYTSHHSSDQDMKLQSTLLAAGTRGPALRMVVWAKSENQAVKKANTRRNKLIREDKWK